VGLCSAQDTNYLHPEKSTNACHVLNTLCHKPQASDDWQLMHKEELIEDSGMRLLLTGYGKNRYRIYHLCRGYLWWYSLGQSLDPWPLGGVDFWFFLNFLKLTPKFWLAKECQDPCIKDFSLISRLSIQKSFCGPKKCH
jgi:hypothetical protein